MFDRDLREVARVTGFEVTFTGVAQCGPDVRTCTFDKPDGYRFTAGQHFSLTLETAEGRRSKPFSHAAAPGDDFIEITTRLSDSAFKRALVALVAGDVVDVSPAVGRFVLPPDPGRVVFLVGGVGITPVRSMVRDAVQRATGLEAVLVFGNRSPDCVPYREELESYHDRGIETVHVFEHGDEDWHGDVGFITPAIVRSHADPARDLFVTAGPPAMVAAMEACMDVLNVPADRRLIERFSGYA